MGAYRENDVINIKATPLPAKTGDTYGNLIMGHGSDGKAHILKVNSDSELSIANDILNSLQNGKGYAVTPNDTNTFNKSVLYVGTGGDVKVRFADSEETVIIKNAGDGSYHPVIVDMVYVTDTDADDIIRYEI